MYFGEYSHILTPILPHTLSLLQNNAKSLWLLARTLAVCPSFVRMMFGEKQKTSLLSSPSHVHLPQRGPHIGMGLLYRNFGWWTCFPTCLKSTGLLWKVEIFNR